MAERWFRVLAGSTIAYLFLLPTQLLAFWRSAAFAVAVVAAAALAVASLREGRRPAKPGPLAVAFAAWAAWAGLTAVWSVDPAHTLRELKSDLAWSILTFAICRVLAATPPAGFRAVAGALLAGLAFWSALCVGLAISAAGWDGRLAHWALGVYTTWLVTVAPFILLLAVPPPHGFAEGTRSLVVALLLATLVAIGAHLADARAVWLAFAAALATGLACSGRWSLGLRARLTGAALLAACALVFVYTAQERAGVAFPAGTTLGESVAADPRIEIWERAFERIGERPLAGHGFGLQILADSMRTATPDPKVTHPHNLFVGQWLQTGAIGLGLFVLVAGLLVARYVALVRSGDAWLARLGTIGLMVIAGFVVRNLTDDFFLRANAKLLFAAHGALLGAAALRARELAATTAPARPAAPPTAG